VRHRASAWPLTFALLVMLGACGNERTAGDGSDEEGPRGSLDAGTGKEGAGPLDARAPAQRRDGGAVRDGGSSPTNGLDASRPSGPFEGEGSSWLSPAPRATCSPGDRPDPSLSGLNGDVRCNLKVLSEAATPHFLSLAWRDDCAYVNGPDGTSVVQVSSSGQATVVKTLTDVGFRSNWESMKASERSGLLAGYESNGATLTVYDLSADCAAPVLQSSTALGALGSIGHAGSFSPDGTIYYASSMYTSSIFAVDLALPKKPVVISNTFERSAHDLFIGRDGKRGYFANPTLTKFGIGSLAIMDLSDVQARTPNATGKLVRELEWEDGNISQYPLALRYRGNDYLLITDELGSGSCADPKKPQWGYARIFDIRDEQDPKLVSLIKTEAQDPKNCEAAGQASGGTAGFGVGTHYCNVDRLEDPRIAACGNWDGGLRVYDIRNPWLPKELAYFDTPTANMPSLARIVPERGQIWIAVTPGTFYVLEAIAGSELARILASKE
jgi:hypothetical protein